MQLLFLSFIATLLGSAILLYFDASTLFLGAILLSIIAIKKPDRSELIAKITGVWFALSVAPAFNVPLEEITHFSNGFIIQGLLSFLFFLYFFTKKPSIIGKIYKEAKVGVGVTVSSAISGFTAGIVSSLLWQGWLQLQTII